MIVDKQRDWTQFIPTYKSTFLTILTHTTQQTSNIHKITKYIQKVKKFTRWDFPGELGFLLCLDLGVGLHAANDR